MRPLRAGTDWPGAWSLRWTPASSVRLLSGAVVVSPVDGLLLCGVTWEPASNAGSADIWEFEMSA